MTLKRAYSVIDFKALDDDQRTITGIASTPEVDRMGDIVVPTGAKFKLPIPLLWQHDSQQPIGHVIAAKVTAKGIEITAQIAQILEPGVLRDRIDMAYQTIKSGLVRGLSIGFRGLETEQIPNSWGVKFLSWEFLELSAVTIPANASGSIQNVKAFDTGHSTPAPVVTLSSRSDSRKKSLPIPEHPNMNTAERIAQFTTERAAKAARMSAIMDAAGDAGSTLNAEQEQEFDTLDAEVKAIDVHLGRLGSMADLASKAAPVNQEATTKAADDSRRYATVKAAPALPKGTLFTRSVIAKAVAKGSYSDAVEVVKQRWPDHADEINMILRAPVAAGTTTDSTWAAPLAHAQVLSNEFVELLRPETILGKLNLRRVPFNVLIPGQSTGSTVGWVGQTGPKPVSALSFADITLGVNKVAGIVVISDELARLSTPSAEALIQADLIAQTAQFLDVSFIDPASTAISGVRPAAVTVGATTVAASGTDSDALRSDVRAAYQAWISTNQNNTGAAWVTTPGLAMAIGMMLNPLGQPEFPGVGATGGTFMGLPMVVSESVPSDTAGTLLVLIKQSEILLADDGGVAIDVSREASLQMNSTPDNPATAATVFTSLWQQNLVGIRAERWITWAKRRPQAVAVITGANYGA